MSLHVKCKMIGASEGVITDLTDVRFVAGVLAVMSPQFVGTCELPVTAFPRALKRLLTCNETQISCG